LPFLLPILAVRLILGIFTLVLKLVALVLRFIAPAITKVAPAMVRWISAGASRLAPWIGVGPSERADRSGATMGAAAELASRLGRGAYEAIVSAAKWVASVKEDLQGEAEREVNPVSLIAKLLVVAAVSSVSIILLISLVLLVASRGS